MASSYLNNLVFSSYLYFARIPRGVSITIFNAPDSGSKVGRLEICVEVISMAKQVMLTVEAVADYRV